jgi:hypothetical protein
MINEANSDLSHDELIEYLAQHLKRKKWQVWTEYVLPDKKRADVYALDPFGIFVIFECKTIVRQWERHTATAKYYDWCNKLYIACNQADPPIPVSASISLADRRLDKSIGICTVDRLDVHELLAPRVHMLDASRESQLLNDFTQRPAFAPWLRGRLTPALK